MLRKYAVTAESHSPVYQLKDYVLPLLTDRCDMFHLDDEFAAKKVYSCLFARTSQFGCPGSNELPLHNQPTLPGAIDQRNLQHSFFPLLVDKARRTPNSQNRKSLNCQERVSRSRNGEVEEVERV